MRNENEHIKIVRLDERFLELSVLGDTESLCSMVYNAMRTNKLLADVLMESVLIYNIYQNDNSSLN